MGRTLFALLLFAGCASPRATGPSVDEAAAPAALPAAPGERHDDELAAAFDAPARPAPKPAPAVSPPRAAPPVDRRAPCREALEQARAALSARRLDEAQAAAAEAVRLADELGAEERHKAHELAFRVALEKQDAARARDAALAWHRACGPEKADTCRAAAVAALGGVAKLAGDGKRAKGEGPPPLSAAEAKKVRALAEDVQEADACLHKSERAQRAEACLGAAERLASRHEDRLLLARAALLRALAEQVEPKKAALLEKAEGRCRLPQCAGVRRRALKALVALELAAGELEAAARHAVRDMLVHAEGLDPASRAWARTDELDRVCAQYDAKAGPGSCRKVEKQLAGGWTFKDYSQSSAGPALAPDVVRQVNEHYAPLLQECLEAQARRLVPPDIVRYEVRWVVLTDGRVGEVHLRKDHDESELARCLRQQFVAWRYPRYDGELQHVEQAFTVSASERHSR